MDKKIADYDFLKLLMRLPFVEQIVLYGSRARGDFHDRSDIDLAIICPHASNENWLEVLDVIENADTLLKIDCVHYDELSDSNPLKSAIDRDGVILYRKSNEQFAN